MHNLIELSPDLKDIFKGLGVGEEETALRVLTAGFKELLIECEKEILEFEVKYGMPFEKFKEDFDAGKFGSLHAYPMEKDASVWEDLIVEKKMRLESLRKIERLSAECFE